MDLRCINKNNTAIQGSMACCPENVIDKQEGARILNEINNLYLNSVQAGFEFF